MTVVRAGLVKTATSEVTCALDDAEMEGSARYWATITSAFALQVIWTPTVGQRLGTAAVLIARMEAVVWKWESISSAAAQVASPVSPARNI